jgi:hypothetical protein
LAKLYKGKEGQFGDLDMLQEAIIAALKLDAYNRTYGQHLTDLDDFEGVKLGNVTIKSNSVSEVENSNASGFYAIAYTAGAGIEGIAPGQSAE